MTSQLNYAFRDYADETSTVGVHVTEVTAANFDATVAAQAALLSAIEGVTLGNNFKGSMVANIVKDQPAPATDPASQRELKWMVRAFDAVTYDVVTIELPCADTDYLESSNSDKMDISTGNGATLVTQIEATCLSKNGNALEVIEIVLVGRAL
jgi:hypothetical protein